MKKLNILLLEGIHDSVITFFTEQGHHVEQSKNALTQEELIQKIPSIHVLGIRSKTQVTQDVLEYAESLLVIGAFCIGTNQINLEAATQRGIAVFNAPESSTNSVVELVIGNMISLSRRIFEKNEKMRRGSWDKSADNSTEIYGKKLGIIGYGNIGTKLSNVAQHLGMEVFYYDLLEKESYGAHRCNSMEELLQTADIITLHVDGRAENANLISKEQFSKMKKGAIFINLSRGHVVDIEALIDALAKNKLQGAGIDVFPEEPNNNEIFTSALTTFDNVILTPHIGGSTKEAQGRIGTFVSKQINDYVTKGLTSRSVNLPQLKTELVEGKQIVTHLHRNLPGRMVAIQNVIAKHSGNIINQILKTTENYGYMVFQLDEPLTEEAMDDLSEVKETLALRVI